MAANIITLQVAFLPYVEPSEQNFQGRKDEGTLCNCPCGSEIDINEWYKLNSEDVLICRDYGIICDEDDDIFTIQQHRFRNILAILGRDSSYWCFYDGDLENLHEESERFSGIFCIFCMPQQFTNILKFARDGKKQGGTKRFTVARTCG